MSWLSSARQSDNSLEGSSSGCCSATPSQHDDDVQLMTDLLRAAAPHDDESTYRMSHPYSYYFGHQYWNHCDGSMSGSLPVPSSPPPGPWSLGYILWSPYSPFQLERQPRLSGIKWRDAFEDLITVTEGRELGSRGRPPFIPIADIVGWICRVGIHSESRDWEEGVMLPTGMMIAQCPLMDTCQEEFEELKELFEKGEDSWDECDVLFPTELDLYRRPFEYDEEEEEEASKSAVTSDQTKGSVVQATNRFLARDSSSETRTDKSQKEDRPSVVATLTAIESVTDEDGKVHTKVVLKKRFADGYEESNETMYTGQAPPDNRLWSSGFNESFGHEKEGLRSESRLENKVAEILSQATGESKSKERETTKKEKSSNSSSWFWSR